MLAGEHKGADRASWKTPTRIGNIGALGILQPGSRQISCLALTFAKRGARGGVQKRSNIRLPVRRGAMIEPARTSWRMTCKPSCAIFNLSCS